MYTLHMSWAFRAAVLSLGFACGLAPQLACFMPSESVKADEMDCCQKMASDCGSSANMSHACCKAVMHTDLGIAAKLILNLMPLPDVTNAPENISAVLLQDLVPELPSDSYHSPPPDPVVSSPILRI
jgi:hypothetical protein